MAVKNVKRGTKSQRHDLTLTEPRPSRRTKNVRLSGAKREGRRGIKRELHVLKAEAVGSWLIDMSLIWRMIGTAILIPLCVITGMAFLSCFGASMEASFWRSAPFWFFMLGMIMWLVVFFGIKRPIFLYVWGHEATHAIFTYLCGGKVHEFNVTKEGGYIVTDKNNLLIALSPYFVPLYAIGVAFVFWLVGAYVDLTTAYQLPIPIIPRLSWQMLGYLTLGASWGFHMTFTVWMIVKDQPDLRTNGTVFSLNVIILANLILLSLLLVQAAPTITWDYFLDNWTLSAKRILSGIANALLGLQQLFGGPL